MSVNLIPQPQSVIEHDGRYVLDNDANIIATGEASDAAWLLHQALRDGTGLTLPVVAERAPDSAAITLSLQGERPADDVTSAEAYEIKVAFDGISIVASHPAGLVRAVYTFRQLLPAATLRSAPIISSPISVPAVEIADEPRFAWRGVMLDVARHFKSKEFVKRMIELAALHRFNVVQLHLTDDQGWRLAVPGWPKLTEISSWREETVQGHASDPIGYDGTPHGGYYTADDLKEIVSYAAQRHITVVPEVDVPGHVRSVLAAYPELGHDTEEPNPVATTFGIFPEVLEPTPQALQFCCDVFDTVVDIFPSRYVHIGGDEVPRTQWRASEAAKLRAEELELADVDLIQSWFTSELAEHLADHGRKIIGWDEILDGGAPDGATVMVWRDFDIANKAIANGHQVVMSAVDALYLDYYESSDPNEPLRISRNTTLSDVIAFEPVPAEASDDQILGVQAQLWSEYQPTPRDVEYSAFPRLSAVSELAWTRPGVRRRHPLMDRIAAHLERLDALGVNYRPLDGPLPWQQGGTGVRARFDVNQSSGAPAVDLPGI